MPGNRLFTDWQFRREVLTGSASLASIGPLRLSVARELWRRRIYFGIIWTGFSDWVAEGEISILDGAGAAEVLRSRWGTTFGASGASSSGWGGNSQTWRSTTGGFPTSSVECWQPPSALPNWGQTVGTVDSITVYGVQRPDGTNLEAARMTMFPYEFIGPVEEIRFDFKSYTVTTAEASPTVEVFIGCKSFKV